MKERISRSSLLLLWAVILTAVTVVFAGVPLKSLRRGLGRWPYWLSGLAVSVAMFAAHWTLFSLAFMSLVILIGLFGEWEDLGLSFLASGFFALLVTTLMSAGAFAFWVSSFGPQWKAYLLEQMNVWLKPALQLSPQVHINPHDILVQLPSILVIAWMITLYLGVLLEQRLRPPYGSTIGSQFFLKHQLLKIQIPTPVVWLFIAALLGSFANYNVHWLQALAINTLNICLVAFFFQGIAVILRLFELMKVSAFWQGLLLILFVVQLFLVVSLLGLADHWVDFRARIRKRQEHMKKEVQYNRRDR